MARRKPAWLQKREADIAQARETYMANRARSTSPTVRKRPTDKAVYGSYLIKSGGTAANVKVPVSKASVDFFGGEAALGLRTIASVTDPIMEMPRNFKPAKVHAMKGTDTPVAHNTAWGSRVIKYSTATTGDAQAFYSAPISNGSSAPSYDAIDAKASTLYNAIKTTLGDLDYARFYVTGEEYTNSKN
jgi:hypothetical protein